VAGINANREVCSAYIEKSLALVTGLVPRIGYDRAAEVAKNAYASGRTVREVLAEEGFLAPEEIDALLTP
jgi:fumarate hydratase class II